MAVIIDSLVLDPEHLAEGLHLEEDEDQVQLIHAGRILARWRPTVTRQAIIDLADAWVRSTPAERTAWEGQSQ